MREPSSSLQEMALQGDKQNQSLVEKYNQGPAVKKVLGHSNPSASSVLVRYITGSWVKIFVFSCTQLLSSCP